jgi:hypothetical protein
MAGCPLIFLIHLCLEMDNSSKIKKKGLLGVTLMSAQDKGGCPVPSSHMAKLIPSWH